MRTTLDIPKRLLTELQSTTKASSRREAVVIALEDYLKRRRLARVIEAAGHLDFQVDPRALRQDDLARIDGRPAR